MDAVDQAWVSTLIPEGAVVEGYVAAVSYLNPITGESIVRIHHEGELQASHLLGMCEMAKHHIFATQVEPEGGDDD